jgi:hypothetical protein
MRAQGVSKIGYWRGNRYPNTMNYDRFCGIAAEHSGDANLK